MIYFEKMHLTNWHDVRTTEPNSPIFFGPCTLITGENKSGKTTVLDALRTAVFVKTSGYNAAQANDVGAKKVNKRSLIGYVRAQGKGEKADQNNFLRKGDVTSNIVVELFNEENQRHFVIGVSFHTRSSNFYEVKGEWWCCENPDMDICLRNCPTVRVDADGKKTALSIRDASAELWEENIAQSLIIFDRQETAKGILAKKYNLTKKNEAKVLDRLAKQEDACIAFTPDTIKNPDDFIRNTLLDDSVLDAQSFFSCLDEYMGAANDLKLLQKKRDDLHDIVSKCADYNRMHALYLATKDAIRLAKQNVLEKQHENAQMTLNEAYEAQDRLNREKEDAEDEIRQKREELATDDYDVRLSICAKNTQTARMRLGDAEQRRSKIIEVLELIARIGEEINMLTGESLVDCETCQAMIEAEEFDTATADAVIKLLDQISDTHHIAAKNATTFAGKLEAMSADISDKESIISSISKGVLPPKNAYIAELKKRIAQKFEEEGITARPLYLYECLNYKSGYEDWQQAAEALIGNQLYAIIIPDKRQYPKAAEVYKRMAKEDDEFYGAIVVDVTNLPTITDSDIKAGSLMEIFEATNVYAMSYLESIIGKTLRVDDATCPVFEKDGRRYSYIDRSRFLYRGNSYFRLAKRKGLVVGAEARLAYMEQLKRELETLKNDMSTIRDQRNIWDRAWLLCESKKISDARMVAFNMKEIPIPSITSLKETLAKYEAEERLVHESMESDDVVKAIRTRIAELENTARRLGTEIVAAAKAVGMREAENQRIESEIITYEDTVAEITEDESRSAAAKSAMDSWLKAIKRTAFTDSIIEKKAKDNEELKDELVRSDALIREAQKVFNRENSTALGDSGPVCMEEYEDNLRILDTNALVDATDHATKLSESLKETFTGQFMDRIRSDIQHADNLLKELNSVMRGMPFDGYAFRFKKLRAFNADMQPYFDLLTSNLDFAQFAEYGQTMLIDIDGMTDDSFAEQKRVYNELFEKISKSGHGESDGINWLNYKSYVRFGIDVIKTHADGTEDPPVDFETWSGVGSGFEVQGSFYAILSISLLNFFSEYKIRNAHDFADIRRGRSIRPIIIDECFSKCDMRNALKLLHFIQYDLHMQIICVAPDDKFETYADELTSVVACSSNEETRARMIRSWTKEEYAKRRSALAIGTKLEYKGYTTEVEYSEPDGLYVGKLGGTEDSIYFQSFDLESFEMEFQNAVDDFIQSTRA